jgi:AAA domain
MNLRIVTADQRLAEAVGKTTIALFGPSGVGKTSQLMTLPAEQTLCVDLEAGLKSVQGWRGDSISIRTFADAIDIAWPDIDGTVGAVVDAQCWGKISTGTYASIPDWWAVGTPPLKRIDAMEAELRSMGALHLRLTCEDPAFNLRLLECRLTADERV